MTPALIAIDWGTSNLRASLLSADGQVLAEKTSSQGVKRIRPAQFADVFHAVCGEWLRPSITAVIACGMVGSASGWKQAAYLPCPASLQDAANGLAEVTIGPHLSVHIVPGVMCHRGDGSGDVMRGEETQIWGSEVAGDAAFILPGTHSKWVRVRQHGRIQSFSTFMTGEFYELLSTHSTLSSLCADSCGDDDAFRNGVRQGIQSGKDLTSLVFSVRSGVLLKTIDPRCASDLLSGMLIGAEIASARDDFFFDDGERRTCYLIGSSSLASRYDIALAMAGIESIRVSEHAATSGLYAIAKQAGLV